MDLDSIKSQLEKIFHIGFVVEKINDGFALKLEGSDDDKFSIKLVITNQIRLNAEVSIERYGNSFLKLINRSNYQKRINMTDLAKKNTSGRLGIQINHCNVSFSEFINDESDWNDFNLSFLEFPYEEKENEYEVIRILKLLTGMMLSLFDYSIEGFEEGGKIEYESERYERNPINREICLAYKGYKCSICGFEFEKKYGDIGKNVIEVHHIKPVSEMGDSYIVKPLEDLIPVCSNCHTIIHKRTPPYTPEEIKEIMKSNSV